MARAKSVLAFLLFVAAVFDVDIAGRARRVTTEIPALWVADLKTLGYPVHPSESFSKTFGVPPTKLAFADPEHLVATFITSDPGTPSERAGRPDSFQLRLHALVFEARRGKVESQRDWPTPNPNDGVVAAHDGKFVLRAGDRLTQYSRGLEALKEVNTALNHRPKQGLFQTFASPTGHFILLEVLPGKESEYAWMDADTLETVHSFSDNLFPLSFSDREIVGWRRTNGGEHELVLRKPDEPGRVILLSRYRSGDPKFVNQDIIALEQGYSVTLIRTDGAVVETIRPHPRDFLGRVTPSADGQRFALTGSNIRNILEILSPHQTWEYVRRVLVYDIPTHEFICTAKVKNSVKNQDFPLALSPDGSLLAFLDGKVLKIYRLPVVAAGPTARRAR